MHRITLLSVLLLLNCGDISQATSSSGSSSLWTTPTTTSTQFLSVSASNSPQASEFTIKPALSSSIPSLSRSTTTQESRVMTSSSPSETATSSLSPSPSQTPPVSVSSTVPATVSSLARMMLPHTPTVTPSHSIPPCSRCGTGTSGPCQSVFGACYELDALTGSCPPGSFKCICPACSVGTSGPCHYADGKCGGYAIDTILCPAGSFECFTSALEAPSRSFSASITASSSASPSITASVTPTTSVTASVTMTPSSSPSAARQCTKCTAGTSGKCQSLNGDCWHIRYNAAVSRSPTPSVNVGYFVLDDGMCPSGSWQCQCPTCSLGTAGPCHHSNGTCSGYMSGTNWCPLDAFECHRDPIASITPTSSHTFTLTASPSMTPSRSATPTRSSSGTRTASDTSTASQSPNPVMLDANVPKADHAGWFGMGMAGGTVVIVGGVVLILAAMVLLYKLKSSKQQSSISSTASGASGDGISVKVDGNTATKWKSWRTDQIVPLSLIQQQHPGLIITDSDSSSSTPQPTTSATPQNGVSSTLLHQPGQSSTPSRNRRLSRTSRASQRSQSSRSRPQHRQHAGRGVSQSPRVGQLRGAKARQLSITSTMSNTSELSLRLMRAANLVGMGDRLVNLDVKAPVRDASDAGSTIQSVERPTHDASETTKCDEERGPDRVDNSSSLIVEEFGASLESPAVDLKREQLQLNQDRPTGNSEASDRLTAEGLPRK